MAGSGQALCSLSEEHTSRSETARSRGYQKLFVFAELSGNTSSPSRSAFLHDFSLGTD